jgi:hypothetical protein
MPNKNCTLLFVTGEDGIARFDSRQNSKVFKKLKNSCFIETVCFTEKPSFQKLQIKFIDTSYKRYVYPRIGCGLV